MLSARKTDGVLNIAFLVGVRRDVQCGVADDDPARISRYRHQRAVAHQTARAQFRFLLHHRAQEHVGTQAALHQGRDLARTGRDSCLHGRLFSISGGHDPAFADVESSALRDLFDLGFRTEQNRTNKFRFGCLDRARQGVGAARVNDTRQKGF
jgi:hypothetical protein